MRRRRSYLPRWLSGATKSTTRVEIHEKSSPSTISSKTSATSFARPAVVLRASGSRDRHPMTGRRRERVPAWQGTLLDWLAALDGWGSIAR